MLCSFMLCSFGTSTEASAPAVLHGDSVRKSINVNGIPLQRTLWEQGFDHQITSWLLSGMTIRGVLMYYRESISCCKTIECTANAKGES